MSTTMIQKRKSPTHVHSPNCLPIFITQLPISERLFNTANKKYKEKFIQTTELINFNYFQEKKYYIDQSKTATHLEVSA